MKTYKFSVCFGDMYYCGGEINITADNEEEATEKAMDHVANKLVQAFPTLDIEYNVECENPDVPEYYCLVISVLDKYGNRIEAYEVALGSDKESIRKRQAVLANQIECGLYDSYADFSKEETLSADIEVHDDVTWELLRIE